MSDRIRDFVGRRLDPAQRYGLRATLFAIAVILVLGPFGILTREVTNHGDVTQVDLSAAKSLHEYAVESPGLVVAMEIVSFVGSPPWFYLLLGGSSVYLWFKKRKRLVAFIVVTGLLGGLVDTAVKVWVNRPRPIFENPVATAPENSFPSGHTMVSTIGYGVLLLVFMPLIPRKWRMPALITAFLLVSLIGFARLALGVHYITDVVGGFVLGLAWLAAATAAFSIWRTEERKKPVEPLEGVEPESIRNL